MYFKCVNIVKLCIANMSILYYSIDYNIYSKIVVFFFIFVKQQRVYYSMLTWQMLSDVENENESF